MINVPNISQSATISKTGTITPKTQTVPNNASNSQNNSSYKPIYPQQTTSVYAPASNDEKLTHTSWFYVNDVHGKMTNMERIYNISREFDRIPAKNLSPNFYKDDNKVAKFKVSSGDTILGEELIHNKV